MNHLFKHSQRRVSGINSRFIRYLYNEIELEDRLIGITGARRYGKNHFTIA